MHPCVYLQWLFRGLIIVCTSWHPKQVNAASHLQTLIRSTLICGHNTHSSRISISLGLSFTKFLLNKIKWKSDDYVAMSVKWNIIADSIIRQMTLGTRSGSNPGPCKYWMLEQIDIANFSFPLHLQMLSLILILDHFNHAALGRFMLLRLLKSSQFIHGYIFPSI